MRKQQTVTLSSCEANYQSLAAAAQKVLLLPQLLCDLQNPQKQPASLGEDNQSAIKLSTNPVIYKRSKRIDVKQHFPRDAVQKEKINILYVPTQKMAALF